MKPLSWSKELKKAELWGDGDARIKKSLKAAGISNIVAANKGTKKASRSIVMVILERTKK